MSSDLKTCDGAKAQATWSLQEQRFALEAHLLLLRELVGSN
jgi:hypothetical protein